MSARHLTAYQLFCAHSGSRFIFAGFPEAFHPIEWVPGISRSDGGTVDYPLTFELPPVGEGAFVRTLFASIMSTVTAGIPAASLYVGAGIAHAAKLSG